MKRTDRRGQPIITLGLLMASWVGARMMLLAAADASSGPLLAQNLEPDRAAAVDRRCLVGAASVSARSPLP